MLFLFFLNELGNTGKSTGSDGNMKFSTGTVDFKVLVMH